MDLTVNTLIDYARAKAAADQDPKVAHECKRRLLDTLACAVAGRSAPVGALSIITASRYSGQFLATIWGTDKKSSLEMAAFTNGTLLRCLDLSDMYRNKCGGHPSDVIGPILSAAECLNSTGKKTLAAVEIAYEIYCGFCDSIDANNVGWDQPLYGGIASAIGVSILLELSEDQMRHALSLSLVPNMPLYQTRTGELSVWKGCAAANGSRNAIFAALLAKDGYTGPEFPIEGSMGLWKILGQFEWKLNNPPNSPAVCRTHFKSFPICYHGQAAAWAAINLFEKNINVDDIECIEVHTYSIAVKLMGADASRWSPNTRETADHSLPYVVTVGLLFGSLHDRYFEAQMLSDSRIQSLMKKVKVIEDLGMTKAYPNIVPCRLSIRVRGGHVTESVINYPKGHEKNPVSDKELQEKASSLFEEHLGSNGANAAIDAIWRIDQAPTVGPMIQLLAS